MEISGRALPTSDLAIVDSGSTYIVGPNAAIAVIAEVNFATCFQIPPIGNPEIVSCASPDGFDAAAIDCDWPFYDIEFKADGETYRLSKRDLLLDIETDLGDVCILRLMGSNDLPVRECLVCIKQSLSNTAHRVGF